MRVIDYAWGRPSIAALKAAGAVAVCRYLSWLPNGKCLSRSEADGLRAGGIDVVSNWEYFGDWAHDYSGGYAKGVEHAREAQRQHLACGGPPGRPIYFSTDFNPTPAQLPTIADYYRGVASVIGLERTGAYGGYTTIRHLFDWGVIRWGWQTYAWSTFRDVPEEPAYLHWDNRAQLRQVRNGVSIGGVDSDLNDTTAVDFGQWGMGDDMDWTDEFPNPGNNGKLEPASTYIVWGNHYAWRAANAAEAMRAQVDALATVVGKLLAAQGTEQASVDTLLAEVKQIGQPSDAQITAQADRIAQVLKDDAGNPVTEAHLAATTEAVKRALRQLFTPADPVS